MPQLVYKDPKRNGNVPKNNKPQVSSVTLDLVVDGLEYFQEFASHEARKPLTSLWEPAKKILRKKTKPPLHELHLYQVAQKTLLVIQVKTFTGLL